MIALDLPGFGSSPVPDWEISIPAYGRLLLDFCDAIDVRDCAVIGNSMGGFVAAEATVAQPDRFERLVLVSAAGVSAPACGASHRSRRPAVGRRGAARVPRPDPFVPPAAARAAGLPDVFDTPLALRPELVWEFCAGGLRAEAFVEALSSLAGYDFLDRLDEIEVPTLIVWGEQDHVVPPADALDYRAASSRRTPRGLRPLRPRADGRAAGAFNRLLEEFLGERVSAASRV